MQIINWTSVNISSRVIIYTAVLKPRSHQLKHLSYHTVLDAGGFFHHILERERGGGGERVPHLQQAFCHSYNFTKLYHVSICTNLVIC